MWIPHRMVALGFGLMLIVALWRLLSARWLSPVASRSQEPTL